MAGHILSRARRGSQKFFINEKSFTLVELLIVIGILAVLTAAVVIAINPGELLKQGRDSQRMQDLASIDKALSVLEVLDPSIDLGTASTVYVSVPDSSATCANLGLPSLPSGWSYGCVASSTLYDTDGTGWIPVNFASSPSLAFSRLSIDPTNTTSTGNYYTYTPGGSWELTGLMEATKENLAAIYDGGMFPGLYQKGSHINLTPGTRDRGLVGYWTFEEGSGTSVLDRSGNGNTGTWGGTGTHYVAGKVGQYAGGFDGTGPNDYVNASGDVLKLTRQVSIAAWVNPTSWTQYLNIAGYNNPGTIGYSFQIRSAACPAGIYLMAAIPTGTAAGPASVSCDSWHHIVATYDGASIKIYLDGDYQNSTSDSDAMTYNSSLPFAIGGDSSRGRWLDGFMDDVRVYNRALSAGEIKAIYDATK